MNNEVVKLVKTDFRYDRKLHAPDGEIGVRDVFLAWARETLRYLSEHLNAEQAAG